jgi:hypothetical protein
MPQRTGDLDRRSDSPVAFPQRLMKTNYSRLCCEKNSRTWNFRNFSVFYRPPCKARNVFDHLRQKIEFINTPTNTGSYTTFYEGLLG